ncbi:MAG: hypothetical protein EBR82_43865 [Caulobacteraceae bacterium]|nr:hypothetical protein [Caulobacteraceae bacterium]
MPPRKKIARKDKPVRELWTVIGPGGELKYKPALGTEVVGMDEELARSLAESADPSHEWRAVPVSQANASR